MKILLYVAVAIAAAHGLIHVMGFVAYWPLAAIAELPYKTTLAGGRWEVGGMGMRVFAILWLMAALGFVLALAGLLLEHDWWIPVMLGTIALSTVLILLDWAPAYRGAVFNAVILVLMALAYFVRGGVSLR
ncbi:MAG TPA: hypothetical protein VGK74_07345 [Symbiobacteriaceae bacterium]|jgi:uncharacterized membrane protein YkvI